VILVRQTRPSGSSLGRSYMVGKVSLEGEAGQFAQCESYQRHRTDRSQNLLVVLLLTNTGSVKLVVPLNYLNQ